MPFLVPRAYGCFVTREDQCEFWLKSHKILSRGKFPLSSEQVFYLAPFSEMKICNHNIASKKLLLLDNYEMNMDQAKCAKISLIIVSNNVLYVALHYISLM